MIDFLTDNIFMNVNERRKDDIPLMYKHPSEKTFNALPQQEKLYRLTQDQFVVIVGGFDQGSLLGSQLTHLGYQNVIVPSGETDIRPTFITEINHFQYLSIG